MPILSAGDQVTGLSNARDGIRQSVRSPGGGPDSLMRRRVRVTRSAIPVAASPTASAPDSQSAVRVASMCGKSVVAMSVPDNISSVAMMTVATMFLYVITLLALLSALVLISNTMTALVAEQTSEIGIMKAVGGRRR